MTLANKALKILIVEDNLGDYTLVKEYLEERFENITCELAINYSDARKLLIAHTDFDVILLDLILPDESCTQLIQKIIAIASRTPVIIMTGSLNLDFCMDSLQLGVSDYLFKDELNPNTLFKSISYTIEKQKTHLQLLESEKKYSDLFNLSPVAMFVYDMDTLKIMDVNAAGVQLYGYAKGELLSMQLDQLFFSKNTDAYLEAFEETNPKNKFSFEDHLILKNKSGKEIKAEITVKTLQSRNKSAKLVVANDITERLLHFDALNAQNKKLKQIAWQQSHEMRSPASKILGIIELFNTELCSKDEQKFLIKEIEITVKELDDVIRSISEKAKQVNPKT